MQTFVLRLKSRVPGLRLRRGDEPSTRLSVRVTRARQGAPVHGELSLRYPGGAGSSRSVDGEPCDSVVDALALMSAIALEPPDPPPDAAPEGEAAPAPFTKASAAETSVLSSPDRAELDLVPGWHVAFGAGVAGAFGVAPVAVLEGAAFVELSEFRDALGSPSFRAGFDFTSTGRVNVGGGAIHETRSVAEADGCPLRWAVGSFRLAPCLLVEAGTLAASGLDVSPERSATRPWLAPGARGSVRYVAFKRFFVQLEGGVTVPLVRDRFYFEPSVTVFRAPPVSGFVGGAAGITIL